MGFVMVSLSRCQLASVNVYLVNQHAIEIHLYFNSPLLFVQGFTSLFLLINRAVPAEKRASVNGLAMTVGSVAKAVGPILGSVGYAW